MTPRLYMDKSFIKQQLLATLYNPFRNKQSCPFEFPNIHTTVLGEGNPNARLMLIGEAPGRDEDLQGRPFVGRSGQLLTKILEVSGLTREDVFITNVLKWRPPNNRPPTSEEMEIGKNLLLKHEIAIINPKVICTLGASALRALMPASAPITQARGMLFYQDATIIAPTYHPAYILRNNKELENFIADILRATELAYDDKQEKASHNLSGG